MTTARPPQLLHIAGVVLCAASWLTLIGLVLLTFFEIDGPGSSAEDMLFGVPAVFRLFGWCLLVFRGTRLALLGALVDAALLATIGFDGHNDLKGELLMSGLLLSNLIPAWWALTGRRWSAVFGGLGSFFSVGTWLCIHRILPNDLVLPLLGSSIVFAWLADASIAYWALRHWRETQVDERRDFA